METAQDQVHSRQQELADLTNSYIESLIEERNRQIDKALEDFYKTTTGYSSLAEMQEAYDRQKRMSELYVDDYKKVYELSKLTRDINKSIDATKLLKGKQELLELEKEINKLQQDDTKMSQFQVENLRRQYELTLAKIQLEEAQNAKSQVTLKQDSEGNWGYVYTANQDDIAAAEQNYEDKLYSIMDANDKYIEETNANMIEAFSMLEESIRAIQEDVTLSEEERQRKIQEAQNDFLEMQRFYSSEIDAVVQINKMLYDSEAYAFEGAMERMENRGGAFIKWNETEFTKEIEGLTQRVYTAYWDCEYFANLAIKQLQQDTQIAINGGGKNGEGLDSMFSGLAQEIAKVQKEGTNTLSQAASQISEFSSNATESLEPILSRVKEINNAFATMFANMGIDTSAMTLSGEFNTDMVTKKDVDLTQGKIYNAYGAEVTGTDLSKYVTADQTIYGFRTFTNQDGETFYGGYRTQEGYDGDTSGTAPDFIVDKNTYKNTFDNPRITYDEPIGPPAPPKSPPLEIQPTGDVERVPARYPKGYSISSSDNSGNLVQIQTYEETSNGIEKKSDTSADPNKDTSKRAIISAKITDIYDDGIDYYYQVSLDPAGNHKTWVKESDIHAAPSNDFPIGGIRKANNYNGSKTFHYAIWNNTDRASFCFEGETSDFFRLPGTDYWVKVSDNAMAVTGQYRSLLPNAQVYYSPYNGMIPVGYDTGGYTGSWGPEGRMAMLHQKEIVLNAHDTENFLTAINIVRSMADQLDANAQIMSQGLLRNISAILPSMNRDSLEQNVTIHAEFPNATNHSEIEEAFGNLVNLAAQYANNKY